MIMDDGFRVALLNALLDQTQSPPVPLHRLPSPRPGLQSGQHRSLPCLTQSDLEELNRTRDEVTERPRSERIYSEDSPSFCVDTPPHYSALCLNDTEPMITSQPGTSDYCHPPPYNRFLDDDDDCNVCRPGPAFHLPSASSLAWSLENLAATNKLVVQQIMETSYRRCWYYSGTRFSIKDGNGRKLYRAFELAAPWQRRRGPVNRAFTMEILSDTHEVIIRITRPFKECDGGCDGCLARWDCCQSQCTIECPPGRRVGAVRQRSACCRTSLEVHDVPGFSEGFTLEGYQSFLCGCGDTSYAVKSNETGETVGMIVKKSFDPAPMFPFYHSPPCIVTFPLTLDTDVKAMILGVSFLVFQDFMSRTRSDELYGWRRF